MAMQRICRLSHYVPSDQDRCSKGHPLASSLMCLVESCQFMTDPIAMSMVKASLGLLKIHMKVAHPENKMDESDDEENVESEKTENDPDANKRTCPFCFKMFYNKENVKRHIKADHEGSSRYKCNDCSKSYASKTSLDYHMKNAHMNDSGIPCEMCGRNFYDFKTYQSHKKSHQSSAPNVSKKCSDCDATFSSKSNLNRHENEVHHIVNFNLDIMNPKPKIYPFLCDHCDYKTKRKHYLKIHNHQQHSGTPVNRLQCKKCPKPISTRLALKYMRRLVIKH